MSAPTLKELCEKATKGPWIFHGQIETYSILGPQNTPYSRRDVVVEGDCTQPGDLYPKGGVLRLTDAQLIARLSPGVMLSIYEFLDFIQRNGSCGKSNEARLLMEILDQKEEQ